MTEVWIALAIALVAIVIGGVVIFRKRMGPAREAASTPSLKERPGEAPARRPPRTEPADEPGAGEAEDARAAGGREAPAEVVPTPKPQPSPKELRTEVESLLSESDRMLEDLQELEGGGGDESLPEMVGILSEGLQEVRSLASREKWVQARDKGEALRSQLVMLLRSARKEQGS